MVALPAAAQEEPSGADPPLSESIVVRGYREPPGAASFETRHALDAAAVAALDGIFAEDVLRRLPAVHVPVNSRGESIAFLRNAAERQVAIFYEGADINIPWDNRLDLSLLPAGLIGSVRTAAGPLAPHYGVNALGAISLSPAPGLAAGAAYGSGDLAEAHLAVPLGPALLGGSYARRDGEPLSRRADLPFSQPGTSLRTNTDRELSSLFGRVQGSLAGQDLRFTAFHVWGDKGIAPEGNRASGARFWRYPAIRHSLLVGSVASRLGPTTRLDSAFWHQRFGQTIDSYASAAYARITARQVDRDRSWGVRELLTHRTGPATLVGSFNLLASTHRQRDIAYVAGAPPAVLPAALLYRQRAWSIGAELEYALAPGLLGEIGLGYDRVDYLRTGDKPPVPAAHDWTGRVGLVFDAGSGWRLRGAAGRKMRAPTMRERFGEGISRFLPNPALRPERIVTAELGAEWRGPAGGFHLIPFVQDLTGTIDQRNVGQLRQRFNLPGSTVRGIELGADWRVFGHLALSGNATWSRVRRKPPPAGQRNRLAEKPALLATVAASYAPPAGVSAGVEAQFTGRAYSADPAGALFPLRRSASVNARLGYRLSRIELFARVDNLADTRVEPQLGLPAPGRTVRLGLRLN
ncbi:TonB-dependent receptor [Sphingomonas sp. ZT3P38]|uniref:TonB-dependent receptor n=1 Tax=Parasphingomonas zepuensis TaxID=3096161 RepID=UPI002FCA5935